MTQYGLMNEGNTIADDMSKLKASNLHLTRLGLMFRFDFWNRAIDMYIQQGYKVGVNFNWQHTTLPVTFCKDWSFIREQAEAFFNRYEPYKNSISFVCYENEWCNPNYRDFNNTSLDDYFKGLEIVVEVGHKYGFKIADSGTTEIALVSWYYSRLGGLPKLIFPYARNKEIVPYVNDFIAAIKGINIDYLNLHWYNNGKVPGMFPAIATSFNKACGNKKLISNEFGIRGTARIWNATVKEIKAIPFEHAIAYSGRSKPGKAMELSVQMLKQLK